jgi:hypothetical protein
MIWMGWMGCRDLGVFFFSTHTILETLCLRGLTFTRTSVDFFFLSLALSLALFIADDTDDTHHAWPHIAFIVSLSLSNRIGIQASFFYGQKNEKFPSNYGHFLFFFLYSSLTSLSPKQTGFFFTHELATTTKSPISYHILSFFRFFPSLLFAMVVSPYRNSWRVLLLIIAYMLFFMCFSFF